ncbi:hypothetical protein NDU88_008819 [Pleurodeles waltl]|uniref:Uncharacterized protein n=1 Tax=Pleurodeles waltl TaxID=8319 RepID=A0AAV7NXD9_PLEWA|nr:hypothetical protein NDU88_008819 [Pleurodeles waltl]
MLCCGTDNSGLAMNEGAGRGMQRVSRYALQQHHTPNRVTEKQEQHQLRKGKHLTSRCRYGGRGKRYQLPHHQFVVLRSLLILQHIAHHEVHTHGY